MKYQFILQQNIEQELSNKTYLRTKNSADLVLMLLLAKLSFLSEKIIIFQSNDDFCFLI